MRVTANVHNILPRFNGLEHRVTFRMMSSCLICLWIDSRLHYCCLIHRHVLPGRHVWSLFVSYQRRNFYVQLFFFWSVQRLKHSLRCFVVEYCMCCINFKGQYCLKLFSYCLINTLFVFIFVQKIYISQKRYPTIKLKLIETRLCPVASGRNHSNKQTVNNRLLRLEKCHLYAYQLFQSVKKDWQ